MRSNYRRFLAAALICLQCISIAEAVERQYGDIIVSEVVRVYDGDTFFVNITGWPSIIGEEIGIRIRGIDTPEMDGESDYERDLARKAKLFAENRLRAAKVVTLRQIGRDKYFRILADVYVDKYSLAKELIRVGLAVEYDGGTKHQW